MTSPRVSWLRISLVLILAICSWTGLTSRAQPSTNPQPTSTIENLSTLSTLPWTCPNRSSNYGIFRADRSLLGTSYEIYNRDASEVVLDSGPSASSQLAATGNITKVMVELQDLASLTVRLPVRHESRSFSFRARNDQLTITRVLVCFQPSPTLPGEGFPFSRNI